MLQSVCLLYTKVQFEIDCSFELCPCTSRAQGWPNMSALYSSNRGPHLSLRCKPISEFNLCCRRPRCRTLRCRVVHLGRSLPIPNCSGASPSPTSGCHHLSVASPAAGSLQPLMTGGMSVRRCRRCITNCSQASSVVLVRSPPGRKSP